MGEGQSDQAEPEKPKRRLWALDPAMFKVGRPRSRWSKIGSGIKSFGFYGALALLFLYPLFLVYIGLLYGWIGFWGTFVGTVAVIGLIIRKAGYSRNFGSFGTGNFPKSILLLIGAFALSLIFLGSLLYERVLALPIFILVLAGIFLASRILGRGSR